MSPEKPWWVHPWPYPPEVRAVVRKYHPVAYWAAFPIWAGLLLLAAVATFETLVALVVLAKAVLG